MTAAEYILSPEGLANVKKWAGVDEIYHLTAFRAVRTAANGDTQWLTITIQDRGPSDPQGRYRIVVKDNDTGAEATGNGEATIEGALMNTHWYELDKSQ